MIVILFTILFTAISAFGYAKTKRVAYMPQLIGGIVVLMAVGAETLIPSLFYNMDSEGYPLVSETGAVSLKINAIRVRNLVLGAGVVTFLMGYAWLVLGSERPSQRGRGVVC